MFSTQRVFGVPIMVEGDFLPILGGVAGFAFFTKLTLMAFFRIIWSMAAITDDWEFFAYSAC